MQFRARGGRKQKSWENSGDGLSIQIDTGGTLCGRKRTARTRQAAPPGEQRMKMQQGCCRRLIARCLVAAGLLCGSGCMSFLHPVSPTLPELAQACQELPSPCRDHVYVFLV